MALDAVVENKGIAEQIQDEIVASPDFSSKRDVREAFFAGIGIMHPDSFPQDETRKQIVDKANKASELLFKGDFTDAETCVVDQEWGKQKKALYGEDEFRRLMSVYTDAFQLAIKEVKFGTETAESRIRAEGIEAVDKLFGNGIEKIIFK